MAAKCTNMYIQSAAPAKHKLSDDPQNPVVIILHGIRYQPGVAFASLQGYPKGSSRDTDIPLLSHAGFRDPVAPKTANPVATGHLRPTAGAVSPVPLPFRRAQQRNLHAGT